MQDRSRASTALRAHPHNAWARLRPLGLVAFVGTILAASALAGGGNLAREAPPTEEAALLLAADFRDGTLQGLRREPEGTLSLSADPLPPEQRPRAYAHRAAHGLYTSPPLDLARPIGRIEATL